MINKITHWFKGLSSLGKVFLSALAIGTTGIVLAAASPSTNTTQPAATPSRQPETTVKMITETLKSNFPRTTINDSALNKGSTAVRTKGVKGQVQYTYEVTFVDGTETSRKLIDKRTIKEPIAQVTAVGTYVAPKVTASPATVQQSNCNPNYSPCVANSSYDLDCPDIGFSVSVIGSDVYRLDADGDGIGCESY